MNKAEFVRAIAKKAGITIGETEKFVEAYSEVVAETLKDGDKIALIGFGTFEPKERAAREGRNPATGETIQIAASVTPSFKPSKALKDAIK